MINILVADDHQIILDGFKSIFNLTPYINLDGTALHGEMALEILERIPLT